MPVVSRFFGISIMLYYRDHEPPHFHARYGDQEVTIGIADGRVAGHFSRQALVMVHEWWDLHRDELMATWELARARLPLEPIEPLE